MKNKELIIWDMDGVLYPVTTAIQADWCVAMAKTACTYITDMNFDNAHSLSREAFDQCGQYMKPFIDDYSLTFEMILDRLFLEMDLSLLKPDPRTTKLLSSPHVSHALLTHCDQKQSQRVINQLGYSRFFDNKNMFTNEIYSPAYKNTGPEPFIITLDKMGYQAENTVFIDDQQKNLPFAKQLGISTVLVHSAEIQESFTDMVFPTTGDFVTFYQQQQYAPL